MSDFTSSEDEISALGTNQCHRYGGLQILFGALAYRAGRALAFGMVEVDDVANRSASALGEGVDNAVAVHRA